MSAGFKALLLPSMGSVFVDSHVGKGVLKHAVILRS